MNIQKPRNECLFHIVNTDRRIPVRTLLIYNLYWLHEMMK
jgi:hypothetical protein